VSPEGERRLNAVQQDVVDNYEAGMNVLNATGVDDWHLAATAYFTAALAGAAILNGDYGSGTAVVLDELESRRTRG
jgi:hypothetical protein